MILSGLPGRAVCIAVRIEGADDRLLDGQLARNALCRYKIMFSCASARQQFLENPDSSSQQSNSGFGCYREQLA